jgi:hypothetical protein
VLWRLACSSLAVSKQRVPQPAEVADASGSFLSRALGISFKVEEERTQVETTNEKPNPNESSDLQAP